MRNVFRAAALAGVLALTATGCSTADTSSTQKALHFNGGFGADRTFEGCVNPSNKQYDRPGASHYIYQMDVRSYDATGGTASEADPIEVLDKNGETLVVPTVISFYLKDNCKTLLDFHNTIGDKYDAYNDLEGDNAGNPGDGWINLLNYAVGKPLDNQLDLIAKRYDRAELRSSEAIRAEMETAITEELPALIQERTGGKQFFERFAVAVSQPETTNEALVQAIADAAAAKEQGKAEAAKAAAAGAKAVAEAQAKEAAAAAAVRAANAEIAVARAEAAKDRARIDGVGGVEAATKRYIADKGLNPDQPTIIYGVPGQPAPAR